jgi:hypothetical protein
MFFIVFFAFAQLGYVLFGAQVSGHPEKKRNAILEKKFRPLSQPCITPL